MMLSSRLLIAYLYYLFLASFFLAAEAVKEGQTVASSHFHCRGLSSRFLAMILIHYSLEMRAFFLFSSSAISFI